VPFGRGVRRCRGAAFAEMEMRVALTEMLRSRVLRSATGAAAHMTRRNATFSPRHGTRVTAPRRLRARSARDDAEAQALRARPVAGAVGAAKTAL
jgi:hypothetical protein